MAPWKQHPHKGRDASLVSPALVTPTYGKTMIQITNRPSQSYTLNSCIAVANFKLMTPQQASNTKLVPRANVLLKNDYTEECEHILNQLFQEQTKNKQKQLYPTPETGDDSSKLNKLDKLVYDNINTLRGKEQLNPTKTKGGKNFCQRSTGLSLHSMKTRKPEWSTFW